MGQRDMFWRKHVRLALTKTCRSEWRRFGCCEWRRYSDDTWQVQWWQLSIRDLLAHCHYYPTQLHGGVPFTNDFPACLWAGQWPEMWYEDISHYLIPLACKYNFLMLFSQIEDAERRLVPRRDATYRFSWKIHLLFSTQPKLTCNEA